MYHREIAAEVVAVDRGYGVAQVRPLLPDASFPPVVGLGITPEEAETWVRLIGQRVVLIITCMYDTAGGSLDFPPILQTG